MNSFLEMTSKSSSSSMTGFCLMSFNHICILTSGSSRVICQEPVDSKDNGEIESAVVEPVSHSLFEELMAGNEIVCLSLVLDGAGLE